MNMYKVSVQAAAMAVALTAVASSQPVHLPTSGPFDGCGVQGSGGDPVLNTQKNRSTEPDDPALISVDQMDTLPTVPSSDGTKRSNWPDTLKNTITQNEGRGVVFIGYIVLAKAESAETCNCELTSPRDHDVHVYIGDETGETTADAVIAEVSPRWRAVNPSWTAANLQSLATAQTQVRLTGWLLYDQEHWNMIHEHERATLWEIHPITNVQVHTSQGWVGLADYVQGVM